MTDLGIFPYWNEDGDLVSINDICELSSFICSNILTDEESIMKEFGTFKDYGFIAFEVGLFSANHLEKVPFSTLTFLAPNVRSIQDTLGAMYICYES